uniref:Uncharacterized protein n=1 Tax=Glossina austeni TaxID=7395 RepID=A0A1A9UHJ2_GLOAU
MTSDQFQQFLNSFLSHDNDVRQQAREAYNNVPRALDVATARQLSQAQLLQQAVTPILRRKLCEVVPDAACSYMDEETQSCAYLQVFQIFLYLNLIKQMLAKSMNSSSGAEVHLQALVDLLPHMIMTTAESIEQEEDESLLKLLIDMTEVWATSDVISDDDTSDNNVLTEASLDRLPCGFDGRFCLTNALPGMLIHRDWKQRYAYIGYRGRLPSTNGGNVRSCNFLRDSHPRVCYAPRNGIG